MYVNAQAQYPHTYVEGHTQQNERDYENVMYEKHANLHEKNVKG